MWLEREELYAMEQRIKEQNAVERAVERAVEEEKEQTNRERVRADKAEKAKEQERKAKEQAEKVNERAFRGAFDSIEMALTTRFPSEFSAQAKRTVRKGLRAKSLDELVRLFPNAMTCGSIAEFASLL